VLVFRQKKEDGFPQSAKRGGLKGKKKLLFPLSFSLAQL
jgi:hypothetical protein